MLVLSRKRNEKVLIDGGITGRGFANQREYRSARNLGLHRM